jgi:hypothetical protein
MMNAQVENARCGRGVRLLVCISLLTLSASCGTDTPAGPQFGSIEGSVRNAATGVELSGVWVYLRIGHYSEWPSCTSGPQGNYRLDHIEEGTHALEAQMSGYNIYRADVDIPGGGTLTHDINLTPWQNCCSATGSEVPN